MAKNEAVTNQDGCHQSSSPQKVGGQGWLRTDVASRILILT
jgi:hypothetical protein